VERYRYGYKVGVIYSFNREVTGKLLSERRLINRRYRLYKTYVSLDTNLYYILKYKPIDKYS